MVGFEPPKGVASKTAPSVRPTKTTAPADQPHIPVVNERAAAAVEATCAHVIKTVKDEHTDAEKISQAVYNAVSSVHGELIWM